jgi:hypothetical protein
MSVLNSRDPVSEIHDKWRGVKWVAYILAVVFMINGIATFTDSLRKIGAFCQEIWATTQDWQLTDAELRDQSLTTARALVEFVEQRQASEPPIDFDNFTASGQLQISHSQATQNNYVIRFYGQVARLREEFKKRGQSDPELDMFYQHPTNYLGLRAVARGLGALGEQL